MALTWALSVLQSHTDVTLVPPTLAHMCLQAVELGSPPLAVFKCLPEWSRLLSVYESGGHWTCLEVKKCANSLQGILYDQAVSVAIPTARALLSFFCSIEGVPILSFDQTEHFPVSCHARCSVRSLAHVIHAAGEIPLSLPLPVAGSMLQHVPRHWAAAVALGQLSESIRNKGVRAC